MRAIRTRPIVQIDDVANASSVYGSKQAAKFLQDVVAGRDSLDIVMIGDSNGGNSGYGYTVGLQRAFGYQYNIQPYATTLLPCGHRYMTGGSGTNNVLFGDGDPIGMGTNAYPAYDDNITISGSYRLMGLYTADSNINDLKTHLGFDTTTINTNSGPSVIQPNRYMWLPVAIPSASTFGGNGTTNYIRVRSFSPLMAGGAGVDLQYRLVHGTWATGSGQFKLRCSNGASTTYAISSFNTTNTGTLGYATTSLSISGQTAEAWCTWDGGASPSSNLVTGPFAGLWHSVIRTNTKGYCVTNLTTSDGRSTTQIADLIESLDKGLDSFLKELRDRQRVAGGSGRVLVFVNSGVNGSESSTTWPAAVNRIVDRIAARWATIGGSNSELAFVFSLSVPQTSTYTGSGSAWKTSRASVATAAQSWANANTRENCSYVEIETFMPAWKLNSGWNNTTYYSNASTDQLHLTSTSPFTAYGNGYDAVAGGIVASLLSSV